MWVNGAIVTGTERNPNGEVYNGNFHNRKRHGEGECFVNDKCIYKGLWEFGAIKDGVQMHSHTKQNEDMGDVGSNLDALNKLNDSHFMGVSDIDGKNSNIRFNKDN